MTWIELINNAGFETTCDAARDLDRLVKNGTHNHLCVSHVTLRNWSSGKTIPRLNILGLVELMQWLDTDLETLVEATEMARQHDNAS